MNIILQTLCIRYHKNILYICFNITSLTTNSCTYFWRYNIFIPDNTVGIYFPKLCKFYIGSLKNQKQKFVRDSMVFYRIENKIFSKSFRLLDIVCHTMKKGII